MHRALVVLLAVSVGADPAPLRAQERSAHIDRYTVDNGLAENDVHGVVQDRAGFIWVATGRGLQRFDGYRFEAYASIDAAAPPELSGMIRDLRADEHGNLWIQTSGDALFRLDPATHRLTRSPVGSASRAWAVDSAGRLWTWHGALHRIALGIPVRADTITMKRWPGSVTAIVAGRTGVWVAATDDGRRGRVLRIEPERGAETVYPLHAIASPSTIMEDGEGRIWVADSHEIEVLDPNADRFRALHVTGGAAIGPLEITGSSGILVTTEESIIRLDGTGAIRERWSTPGVFGAAVMPRDITLDREGGIWLGTLASGLIRLDRTGSAFEHASSRSAPPLTIGSDFITALADGGNGSLWIGTIRAGAYRFDAAGRRLAAFRHDPRNPASLASDEVWAFEEDRAGTFWVGTADGLCAISRTPIRCFPVPREVRVVEDIERDPSGWFWLATYSPLVMSFDPASGRYGTMQWVQGAVLSLYMDSDSGYLWMGGGSLHRMRVAEGRALEPPRRVEASASEAEPIYAFHRDRTGVLWLASYHGLQRWDAARGRFAPVPIPEVHDATVFSVAEDTAGGLWLGTSRGIVHYVPVTGVARRYGREDGVMSGEFNRRAALTRGDGEMLFGGVEGLVRFRPEMVTNPRQAPPVALTRWRRVTANGPVDAALAAADGGGQRLRVEPGDRAFSIDFAALTFGPAARRYRYRLAGDAWIESSDRSVTFAAPRPGHYVFTVQTAIGADGAWSEPGASLALDVVPPFWATAWFKALLVALFIASLLLWHRLRLTRALATERLRLRISRDLHDEIGAGLSSIALLSDAVGAKSALSDRDRGQLQRVARSARDMVADLRDIVWAIDPDSDKLEDVVSRMKDVTSDLLRDVDVSFRAPPGTALHDTIGMAARRDLLLLFKELLHNVARHARARSVRIDLDVRRDHLELVIVDDGVGFDPAGVTAGTGIRSVRERAARLGGSLDLSSEPGRGTTARLTVKTT